MGDRCAALEERAARLLDEIALLQTRADVDIPHWAGELRNCSQRLEETAAPFATVPLGEKLLAVLAGYRAAEAGLRGLNAAPLREEMSELKKSFAEQVLLSQEREEALRVENDRLRQLLASAGADGQVETRGEW